MSWTVTCINPAENYLLQAHLSSLGHLLHCPDRTLAWSAARHSANIKSVSCLKLPKPQGRSWRDKRGDVRVCRSSPQQDLQQAGLIKERRGWLDRTRASDFENERCKFLYCSVYLLKQIWPQVASQTHYLFTANKNEVMLSKSLLFLSLYSCSPLTISRSNPTVPKRSLLIFSPSSDLTNSLLLLPPPPSSSSPLSPSLSFYFSFGNITSSA